MRYIDTFDHEYVASFGGLPIYLPLVEIPGTADVPRDFACGPGTLVIGGGGGEHPGLVVKDPSNAVARFLRSWLDESEDWPTSNGGERRAIVEAWAERLRDEISRHWADLFDFAGSSVMDYIDFRDRCASAAFPRPYRREVDGLVGSWLAASIGEFVFYALPELATRTLALVDEPHAVVDRPLYENVLLKPLGYPCFGRRTLVGKTVWGASSWRIERSSGWNVSIEHRVTTRC